MMKTKSTLLMCLLASSYLASCTSVNKSTGLNERFLPKQKIVATKKADLIKATSPDQYYEIGRNYQKNGNYSQATIAYQKSLQLDPSYTKSLTSLATIYADQKLYIISVPLFEQVTKLEPNAINYNNLGYAYYLNKQYVEANRVLTQAILLEPDYLQAQRNLALVASNQSAIVNSELTREMGGLVTDSLETSQFKHPAANNDMRSNNLQLPTISSQASKPDLTSNVVETNSELKIVQSGSGVYELIVKPIASGTLDINSALVANTQDKSTNILVAISGGITYKHIPAISKLFDLAQNQIASFNISDNNKFIEIINGNGTKGIARAVAKKINENSTIQTKVADAKRFNQTKTHIQYKKSYRDDAVNLNHHLLNKPYLVRNDNLPSDVALRLVLGSDLI